MLKIKSNLNKNRKYKKIKTIWFGILIFAHLI